MLSTIEQSQLHQYETTIQNGLKAFYEVGQALKGIRDRKLYRANYPNFEDYLSDRWQMSRPRAYELMGASEVVENLSAIADSPIPANETQARPLTRLDSAEQQHEAMAAATAIAPNNKPTSAHVARAAEAIKVKPELFPAGKKVTVLDENSVHYGQEVEVVESEGVIVQAKTGDGQTVAFLSNELTGNKSVEQTWATQKPKHDRTEAAEAALEVEQMRVDALEERLTEAVELLKKYAHHQTDVQRFIMAFEALVA